MTTTNSGVGERTDDVQPNNVRRWLYTAIAILFAGVAGYLFAYAIGIAIDGSANLSWTFVQLLGGFATGALCVVFMRFAAQHAPKKPEVDPS